MAVTVLGALTHPMPKGLVIAGITEHTEQKDEEGLEAVGDESEGLCHWTGDVVEGGQGLDHGEMPRTGSSGCGEEHTDTGYGKNVDHIGKTDAVHTFETRHQEIDLQEVAEPDSDT